MLGFEKRDSNSLSLLFWPLSGGGSIFLSFFLLRVSIFLVGIKEEDILVIQVRQSAGSLTKKSKTSSFIHTIWLALSPHSLIEDFSMCHPAFSLPGLADAIVAEISGFPLTPLQSLQESFTQTKQQQAAGSHSSPEYRKTCSGITHVCNPVCLHACTCMFCIWYSVYISVCVRRSEGRPDRF